MHYSLQVDEQFTVVFMTVSHSAQMLLKLEKCISISHVTLETVPKYAKIERPTSSQLYASRVLCKMCIDKRSLSYFIRRLKSVERAHLMPRDLLLFALRLRQQLVNSEF